MALMNRLAVIFFVSMAASVALSYSTHAAEKPNIIVIMTASRAGRMAWISRLHLAYTSKPAKNTVLVSLKNCFHPIAVLTAENSVS
jgi:hypothetical protein